MAMVITRSHFGPFWKGQKSHIIWREAFSFSSTRKPAFPMVGAHSYDRWKQKALASLVLRLPRPLRGRRGDEGKKEKTRDLRDQFQSRRSVL